MGDDGDAAAALQLDKRAIRAVVRVRPMKPDEEGYITTKPRRGKEFKLKTEKAEDYSDTFSMVLGPESTQHEVFR